MVKTTKGIWALAAVAFLAGSAGTAQAASDDVVQGMGDRFKRGIVDTFTGFLEWPFQTVKGYKRGCSFVKNETGSKVTGTVIGLLFAGPSHAIGRTGSGMGELFGFWMANPADNKDVGTPLDAEFAWEDGTPYSIFEPTLGEGIKPWGNKIVRGLGNGLLGWLDFPGQIVKGCRAGGAGNIGKGVVKGLWFGVSRTAYGSSDVFGFLFPNHPDQKGYAFEEKWAWDSFNAK